MAYLTNSIGAYSFADLVGAIARRQQQIEIFERPGITGSGLRTLGSRGKPFTLKAVAYVADLAAAKTLFEGYIALPGTATQAVTRDGVNHGNYFVLEVEEISTIQVLNVTGNVTAGSTVCLTTNWKLLG
jgi:hypothetical protein